MMPGMDVDEMTRLNGGTFTPPGSDMERQLMYQMSAQDLKNGQGQAVPELQVAGDGEPMCADCSKFDRAQRYCKKYDRKCESFQTCSGHEADISNMMQSAPPGLMNGGPQA